MGGIVGGGGGSVAADSIGTDKLSFVAAVETFLGAANAAAMLSALGTGTPGSGNYLRGDGSWQAITSGKVAQVVSTLGSAVLTGTTTVPADDTIPQQSTEGTLFYSRAITPTNASSNLLIIPILSWACSVQYQCMFPVFVDSTADAINWGADVAAFVGYEQPYCKPFLVAAVSTSARTYKLHGGPSSAATVTINGVAGARRGGGVASSGLIILEILP